MDLLNLGDPWQLSTDVGPGIDAEARDRIDGYIAAQKAQGRVLKHLQRPQEGLFIAPTVLRSDGIAEMEREVFGPILHVAIFAAGQIDAVNAKGYGLIFGLHTRIDRRVQHVLDRIEVGNVYVNRDQIGAIVGSQPFGGQGLSGTGPKVGGAHYLPRFLRAAHSEISVPAAESASAEAIAPRAGQAQCRRLACEPGPHSALAQAAARRRPWRLPPDWRARPICRGRPENPTSLRSDRGAGCFVSVAMAKRFWRKWFRRWPQAMP
ncbi:MAG: aldehyde dehydrogenase family protein, partial [Rhodospirillales bacterium]|nr:aldehyde dehydrogenase family protein [Rhodospirillales bacterium]